METLDDTLLRFIGLDHRQLTLQWFAFNGALYLAAIRIWERLDYWFAVRVAVIQRTLPNRNPSTLANMARDETGGIVVRMSAFVSDGQQVIRLGFRDNLFESWNSG